MRAVAGRPYIFVLTHSLFLSSFHRAFVGTCGDICRVFLSVVQFDSQGGTPLAGAPHGRSNASSASILSSDLEILS